MKKQFLVLAVALSMLLPLSSFAQNPAVDKLYEKYRGKEGFTCVNVSKDLLQMFSDQLKDSTGKQLKIEGEEGINIQELMNGVKSIKVLSCKEGNDNGKTAAKFYKDIKATIPLDDYKELLSVDEGSKEVRIVYKSEETGKGDFIILVHENKETTLVNITGHLDMKQMSGLSKLMKMKALKGGDEHQKDKKPKEEKAK